MLRIPAAAVAACVCASANADEPVPLLDSGPKLDCVAGLTHQCLFREDRMGTRRLSMIIAIDWLTPELVFHGLLPYGPKHDAVDYWVRRGPGGAVEKSRFVVTYAARPHCRETVVTCDRGGDIWRCSAEGPPQPLDTEEQATQGAEWPRCTRRSGATIQPTPPLTDSFPDVA